MTENIDLYQNQIIMARTEIKNLRQRISALKQEHQKEIKHIKSILNNLRCSTCAAAATSIVNDQNISEASISESNSIPFQPIGYIETSFCNKRGVPRQPSVLANVKGSIIIDTNVFNNPEHALSGLEEFSHIWIIFYFHITESNNVPAKVSPPRLGGERRGVFSTRSPHRPCPIGLSLVKIHSIEGNKIYFNGVDMVNGTPVLDIKPYIPQYDYPQTYGEVTSALERPPTEGNNDNVEMMANLHLDEDISVESLSPRLSQPVGIDTSSPLSSTDIISPGIELVTPISPPESPTSEDLLDGPVSSPIRRVESERGAPDGQERFTPPQNNLNVNQDGVRVASWVNNPPALKYQVNFTEDALNRLNNLIGDRAPSFKSNIESLLSEDPRSVYMFLTRSEYDRGVNTFSPEGRLFQVEYAIEAIKLGSTAIGIATSEGVVLAVEKRITSPLMEPTTIEKIVEVDRHIACAVSGLMADSRTLIERARVECQNHWFVYNERMTVESCAQAVSNLAIQFGDSDDDSGTAMSRPFGVAVMFAGIDEKGPQLFHMDPSGTFVQYDAKAIGSGSEGAQQSLKEVYHKSMTLKEAIKSALTILKQVMEEKLSENNVEVVTMTPQSLFHMFTREQLAEVIKDIP